MRHRRAGAATRLPGDHLIEEPVPVQALPVRDPLARLIEAAAEWQLGGEQVAVVASAAAADALAAGAEGAALAELAGVPRDENPFVIRGLLEGALVELGGRAPQSGGDAAVLLLRARCVKFLTRRLSSGALGSEAYLQWWRSGYDDRLARLADLEGAIAAWDEGFGRGRPDAAGLALGFLAETEAFAASLRDGRGSGDG